MDRVRSAYAGKLFLVKFAKFLCHFYKFIKPNTSWLQGNPQGSLCAVTAELNSKY